MTFNSATIWLGVIGAAVWLALVLVALALGRAAARGAAMLRHPSSRERGPVDCSLLRPERELPTRLGADACCDVCGWPFLSYEHYCECRR